jgi:hypothetical protein
MAGTPLSEEQSARHRRFAVEANNRAWALSESPELSADEERELLFAAYAAAHHWSKVGTEENFARADLLLGRAHARLGHGELAMKFATRAFDSITARDSEPWERAYAHAVLANAAAISGDTQLHAQHYEKAKDWGRSLADPEDRDIFFRTFNQIPSAGGP